MNILHYVTQKQEISPKLKKLKASCDAAAVSKDEAAGGSSPSKDQGATGLDLYDKEELQKRLSPAQFRVTQKLGTEKPFSGKYVKLKEEGQYNCVVCGTALFTSDVKYDSGSGWPAFYDVISKDRVALKEENLGGLQRMEVKCAECKAHLGHVFDDGPKPTGIRYCVNSCSLDFKKHTTV
ncbi:peptide methionine sulfoxide reductase msrb-like [Plakobranchus ocellatus]|uniref:Peptide-methionine (R)-S-oxide reductase n=1 Tax=Plakobranchus ocellatus TaxID=259542 RepID=A0AAV4BVM0_9GAST|nr:peptide methionine sulfoxide reductase msrb-like [Plakobranchus ocellatus]